MLDADVVRLRCSEPRDTFAFQPLALALRLILHRVVDAGAIHLVLSELTNVVVAAGPEERTLALPLALKELAFVFFAILVSHDALPVHHVVLEVTLVELSFVSELISALAVETSVNEVSFVGACVGREDALTGLLAVDVVALEAYRAFLPLLGADALLLVVDPRTVVDGLLLRAVVKASSACLTVNPVAPVGRAV